MLGQVLLKLHHVMTHGVCNKWDAPKSDKELGQIPFPTMLPANCLLCTSTASAPSVEVSQIPAADRAYIAMIEQGTVQASGLQVFIGADIN